MALMKKPNKTPDENLKRLLKEITGFLSLHNPQSSIPTLTIAEVGSDTCGFFLKMCSALNDVHTRLTFLDKFIRRSSVWEIGPDDYLGVLIHLVDELRTLELLLSDESKAFPDVCLILQLMSHCLSKAPCTDAFRRILDESFDTFVFLSQVQSVDCLIACFTVLVNILRIECGDRFWDTVHTLLIQPSTVLTCSSPGTYLVFIKQLLLDDGRRASQLAFLLAIIGQLPEHHLFPNRNLFGTFLCQILSFTFALVSSCSKRGHSTMSSTILILLSKIAQSWSSCHRKYLCVHSGSEVSQSLSSSAELINAPVNMLLEFCLEMKGSPFSVVRHCCLDTIGNLMQAHFASCDVCNSASLCEVVMNLFHKFSITSWLTRGTLSVIQRIVAALFQNTRCTVIRLLPVLSWESCMNKADVPHQLAYVASSLLDCAVDPGISMHVSELYTLIGSKLLVEHEELLHIWLSALATLAAENYRMFGPAISQYILPSLFSSDYTLLCRLINLSQVDGSMFSVPLLLTCYRLLKFSKHKVVPDDDIDRTHSINSLLRIALVSSDLQIRLDALNLLRTSIQREKDPTDFIKLLDLVFYCLQFNQWSTERPFRHQLCYTIFVAMTRVRELTMKSSIPSSASKVSTDVSSAYLEIIIRMAALLLQGIYPGAPAPRLSFCLNGLYSLIMALCQNAEDAEKVLHDGDSRWTTNRILNQAAWLAHDLRVTNSSNSLPLSAYSYPLDCDLLTPRLFVGLSSAFEDDREFALQLCLLLRIPDRMPSVSVSHLLSETLTILATSAKPDVNPLAWQLVLFIINSDLPLTPIIKHMGWCPSPFDNLPIATQRAFHIVYYLLDLTEHQVHSATSPDGLLAVAATRPFYAMLGTIRAILSPRCPSLAHMICRTSENNKLRMKVSATSDKYCVKRLGDLNSVDVCFRRFSTSDSSTSCIASRLITLALRISNCILPVLAHASPEGLLLNCHSVSPPVFELPQLPEPCDEHQAAGVTEARKYPEYVTICCWRSVRELSLLLGISLTHGLQSIADSSSWDASLDRLSELQVLEIGEFFCSQLLCGRHCGAVEQCSLGFYPFCQALLRTNFRHWPLWWLHCVLDDLLESPSSLETLGSPNDLANRAHRLPLVCLQRTDEGYCATRRSAGLPLFIKDILSANCAGCSTQDSQTPLTLNRLLSFVDHTLKMIRSSDVLALHSTQRCVVSLNIARTLFRCTCLTQSTSAIIERAICLSFDGLGCSCWAIRNSSSLLFSTLIERIFGVTRSSDVLSPKKSLSIANLFTRYPSLRQHFIRIVQETTQQSNSTHTYQTRTYAVLVLLSRLLPPNQLSNDSDSTEVLLRQFVIRCLSNCNIRIRQMAARSLGCLIHTSRLSEITRTCINQLERLLSLQPSEQKRPVSSNFIHGLLLLLQQLFASDRWPQKSEINECIYSAADRPQLLKAFSETLSHLADPSLTKCPLIRKAYLSISNLTISFAPDRLCQRGLHLEASAEFVRKFVHTAVTSLKEFDDRSNACDFSLPELLQQLRSVEYRMLALREVLCTVLYTTPNSLDPSSEPCIPLTQHASFESCFLDHLAYWINPPELLKFLKTLSISDEAGALVFRYALLLLAIVFPTSLTEVAFIASLISWLHPLLLSLRLDDCLAAIYLPSVVQLFSDIMIHSPQADAVMHSFRVNIVELLQLCVAFSQTLINDTNDLKRGLLYAIAALFHSSSQLPHTDYSDELVRFLLASLLNLREPDLQDLASKCCRWITTGHFDNRADVPLPFVVYSEFIHYLLQSGWFVGPKLISLVAELFPLNFPSLDEDFNDERETRVFTHEDPHSMNDLIASLNTATWAVLTSQNDCSSKYTVDDNVAETIRDGLSAQLQMCLSCSLFTKRSDVYQQFALRCIALYQRAVNESFSVPL